MNSSTIPPQAPGYEKDPSYAPSDASSSIYPVPGGTPSTIKIPAKLVYDISWVSSTSYLGRTKDERLFAVESPSRLINCFGLGRLVLRDGADKLAPPLASVGVEKGSKFRRSLIQVAAKPGTKGLGEGGEQQQQQHLEISMSGDWGRRHAFSMPLWDGRVERFEWRNSRGDEVREISDTVTGGWKLMRLDGPRRGLPLQQQRQGGRGGGVQGHEGYQEEVEREEDGEGEEVVAVGAPPRLLHKRPLFSLLNSGATGELGETFEIVALMGFLRLYELHMQQSAANSSASSSSAAAAAAAS